MPTPLTKARLLQVAEKIEADHDTFYMGFVCHNCGTPSCIAGYTLALFDPEVITDDHALFHARRILHLTELEANELFLPLTSHYSYHARQRDNDYITPHHAARTLRHLATTGIIDWDLTA